MAGRDKWTAERWLLLGGPLDGELRMVEGAKPCLETYEQLGRSVLESIPSGVPLLAPSLAYKTVRYIPESWTGPDGKPIYFARVEGDEKPVLEYLVTGYMESVGERPMMARS